MMRLKIGDGHDGGFGGIGHGDKGHNGKSPLGVRSRAFLDAPKLKGLEGAILASSLWL